MCSSIRTQAVNRQKTKESIASAKLRGLDWRTADDSIRRNDSDESGNEICSFRGPFYTSVTQHLLFSHAVRYNAIVLLGTKLCCLRALVELRAS